MSRDACSSQLTRVAKPEALFSEGGSEGHTAGVQGGMYAGGMNGILQQVLIEHAASCEPRELLEYHSRLAPQPRKALVNP